MREYDESELRPLDHDQADFIVGVCVDLDKFSEELDEGPLKSLLQVSSSNLLRLTALSMAGYHLYSAHRKMNNDLYGDLQWAAQILGEYQPSLANALIEKYKDRMHDLMREDKKIGDDD